MARYCESVCRLCRREKVKLFLKGERCYTEKCAIERRAYAPGQHGQLRSKLSDYGAQLREKQKAKRIYGVLERQFRRYVQAAERTKGITGDNLIRSLETRLDNLVFRMGFATSRTEARQLVRHRHFHVNGRLVDIPSFPVKLNDEISVREGSKTTASIVRSLENLETRGMPKWLQLNREAMKGSLLAYPTREEVELPVREQLIIELYSK